MSTTIKATCSPGSGGAGCGGIQTNSDNVVLRLRRDQENGEGEYRFICPKCNKIVIKQCSWTIVALLLQSDCKVERFDLPLELLERPREEDADPITLDDVIDLGLALQNDEEGWLRKMIQGKKEQ